MKKFTLLMLLGIATISVASAQGYQKGHGQKESNHQQSIPNKQYHELANDGSYGNRFDKHERDERKHERGYEKQHRFDKRFDRREERNNRFHYRPIKPFRRF